MFRSKTFRILALIALFAAVFASVLSLTGHGTLLKEAVNGVTYPVRLALDWAADGIEGYRVYFSSLREMKEENEKLQKNLQDLNDQSGKIEALERENEELRAYLAIREALTAYTFTEAHAVGMEGSTGAHLLTLNVGSVHGIESGMCVVCADGLVGRVSEVGLTYCRVKTLFSADTALGAYNEKNHRVFLVSGDWSQSNDGYLNATEIAEDADIAPRDCVYSAGGGGVYPAGFLIGRVAEVSSDAVSRTKTAKITPAVSYAALSQVLIITGTAGGEPDAPLG